MNNERTWCERYGAATTGKPFTLSATSEACRAAPGASRGSKFRLTSTARVRRSPVGAAISRRRSGLTSAKLGSRVTRPVQSRGRRSSMTCVTSVRTSISVGVRFLVTPLAYPPVFQKGACFTRSETLPFVERLIQLKTEIGMKTIGLQPNTALQVNRAWHWLSRLDSTARLNVTLWDRATHVDTTSRKTPARCSSDSVPRDRRERDRKP